MHLWSVIVLVAGFARVGYGVVLDPLGGVGLMQEKTDECLSGEPLDVNFIDTTLSLLNPAREPDVTRSRDDVLNEWHRVQRNTARKIRDVDEQAQRMNEQNRKRVLIVQAAKGVPATIRRVKHNMDYLRGSAHGHFKWALFIYGGFDEWEKEDWYRDSIDIVKRDKVAPGGCEVQHIRLLTMEFLQDFDYVWLMDDDIDVSFLDWELYATILASAKPLVSQPSIIAGSSLGRTTELEGLRMVQVSNGEMLVAAERPYSEVMAPMIATKLWPAIHARAATKVTKCDSDLNIFWDTLAFLGRVYCNITAVAVMNAAPVSHVDCRTMPNVNSCFTNCEEDLNMPISAEQAELARAACSAIPSDWLQRWQCDGANIVGCLENIRSAALKKPKQLTLQVRASDVAHQEVRPGFAPPDVVSNVPPESSSSSETIRHDQSSSARSGPVRESSGVADTHLHGTQNERRPLDSVSRAGDDFRETASSTDAPRTELSPREEGFVSRPSRNQQSKVFYSAK